MQDPKPENIMGEKSVTHSVEHKINWGHFALGFAVIYVVYKGSRFLASDSDSSEDIEDGEIIGIEEARGEVPDVPNP
jgi:hypothetical protein